MEDRKSPLVSIGHDSSDFLKGIAIFGVLLSHTGRIFTEFSIVLFLVISGFGLELSYRKKGFAGFWGRNSGTSGCHISLWPLLRLYCGM